MSERLESGVSIATLSIFVGGMHYACPRQAALDALERLLLVERCDIVSSDDRYLVERRLAYLAPLPRCVIDSVSTRVRSRARNEAAAHS